MWTILDWTNPGRLGTSRQWQKLVVKPLTTGQSAAATEEERAQAQASLAVELSEKKASSQTYNIDGCADSQEQASS